MATYTKGYKKQSGEMVLLKLIIGIIGVVLFTVLVAYLYDTFSDVGSYDDWTHVDAYDEILVQEDENGDQVQDYIVYFYKDDCPNCAAIQRDALRIVSRLNRDATFVYFVNIEEIEETTDGDKDEFLDAIGRDSVLAPMLVVVSGGVFEEAVVGPTAVIDLLTNVKNGDYAPFQD